MNNHPLDYDLFVFDVEGTLFTPKAKKAARKARKARVEGEGYEKVVAAYLEHLNRDVLLALDDIPSSADVVVISERGTSRQAEILAFLQHEFFPRVGAHVRRVFVSFRLLEEETPRDKVQRILTFCNACRSINGKVEHPKRVLIFDDDSAVLKELKKAKRQKLTVPRKISVRQPLYSPDGKRLPIESHKI